jgi:hypothetical protein
MAMEMIYAAGLNILKTINYFREFMPGENVLGGVELRRGRYLFLT